MSSAPHRYAAIVHVGGDVVVGADDVEIAGRHPLDQHVDDLIRGPGARRLFGRPPRGHAGEGRAGHQQVRSHSATVDVAQRVRETLGQHLDPGLGDVVGGVARRAGDALLGAGVDDGAAALAGVDHRLARTPARR